MQKTHRVLLLAVARKDALEFLQLLLDKHEVGVRGDGQVEELLGVDCVRGGGGAMGAEESAMREGRKKEKR